MRILVWFYSRDAQPEKQEVVEEQCVRFEFDPPADWDDLTDDERAGYVNREIRDRYRYSWVIEQP